jgi:hypothetical protein
LPAAFLDPSLGFLLHLPTASHLHIHLPFQLQISPRQSITSLTVLHHLINTIHNFTSPTHQSTTSKTTIKPATPISHHPLSSPSITTTNQHLLLCHLTQNQQIRLSIKPPARYHHLTTSPSPSTTKHHDQKFPTYKKTHRDAAKLLQSARVEKEINEEEIKKSEKERKEHGKKNRTEKEKGAQPETTTCPCAAVCKLPSPRRRRIPKPRRRRVSYHAT